MTVTAGSGPTALVMLASPRSARFMIGLQTFVVSCYFAGAGGLLLAAAIRHDGLSFAPFGGAGKGPDPMTLMPDLGGVELLLYLPVFLVAVLWLPIGLSTALGGVLLLINRMAWRENLRLMCILASSTAVVLAYLIVSLTDFGASIQQWLLN
ncbi:MAG TPA: hypothetical protein DGT23_33035 [Micromonosporaceae bacterium]|nr:hypothetical protein [Micromonosporaceae bacterium]